MKVKDNEAYREYIRFPEREGFTGVRIKDVRHTPLSPGGRVKLSFFEHVADEGRPHPRMQFDLPAAKDPRPPGTLFAPQQAPATPEALRSLILAALETHRDILQANDLSREQGPQGSQQYFINSIRAQRLAAFFNQVRSALTQWQSGSLAAHKDAAERVLRELEADTYYNATIQFDDNNMGTYHSYLHDAPFVHYLEAMLASLPDENTQAMAVLPGEAQEAVRRQRQQLLRHLDYLMRYKYAFEVVKETDIERTVGGMLMDRKSRNIVSEVPSPSSLRPRYELLRIPPGISHPHAGAWIYRDGQRYFLQNGTAVNVAGLDLRSTPVEPADLTFRRAPRSERLRAGMRLDWDNNGWVQAGRLDWVLWAGHCDVQGILETVGVTMADNPRLREYRSDTDKVVEYHRDLLLEMIASAVELGSRYRRADGTGTLTRGIHHFGGARNDSRPDRLQFTGLGEGRHFRWPIEGRQESFRVTSLAWPNERGALQRADMGTVYYKSIPNLEAVDFTPNPRFLKTVEGDYNLIDVSGALVTAKILVDEFDENTGYPTSHSQDITIDLRPNPQNDRYFLGTHIEDVAGRRLYRVYLDRKRHQITRELFEYKRQGGKWRPKALPERTMKIPLSQPLACTLSHEMRRDNPEMYQALLDIAMRQGQNICADTDMKVPVWNGVVTRIAMKKRGENREKRTQAWQVDITARFGKTTLQYLVRRDERGRPVEYCPAVGEDSLERGPDFMYQDLPDVGSKGMEAGEWVINDTMLSRGLIEYRVEPSAPGGFYVYDDHIKNVYEVLYTALAGYGYSIVHNDKRYGFQDEQTWNQAIAALRDRRSKLTFTD